MDASARQKAEMAQKIAQELLKSSSHRLASAPQSMPALNTEQSNLVRAAQQKAAEIAVQVPFPLFTVTCCHNFHSCVTAERVDNTASWRHARQRQRPVLSQDTGWMPHLRCHNSWQPGPWLLCAPDTAIPWQGFCQIAFTFCTIAPRLNTPIACFWNAV